MTSTLRDNRVREFRKRAGLTQAELGARVGVSRQSIVSTEKGDYAPSVYLALRLARSLGSTVEELFPLTEEGR
ncbi:helix-turn-helix transcriptional regulator [Rhodococcus artemisiae]|uniref:Helix-turn-helix transcriptional regulator n=1 Tax=Rhodococcus artemisiae TaxID=714159 RepID=A0ABU7LEB2_9NOCA|nr:helix-turn-helix transcriptional regulator [Rhodococcus artemisiae]MEE2059895.1 helix-turn-helix transcriptional regulator [Rhodococcus artemisiae]